MKNPRVIPEEPEKKTGKDGVCLDVRWIKIQGDNATATGSFVTYGDVEYRFRLQKDGQWKVKAATLYGTSDPL